MKHMASFLRESFQSLGALEVCPIGRYAVLGSGRDLDLLVCLPTDRLDGKWAIETARSLGADVVEHMTGPFVPHGQSWPRWRAVWRTAQGDDALDVVFCSVQEFVYVTQRYAEARAGRSRFRALRETEGKLAAYNAFGIALIPRQWVPVEV